MKRDALPAVVPVPGAAREGTAPDFEALRALDRLREAHLGRFGSGLSPESLLLAWTDWAVHLAVAPGKRIELMPRASQALAGFAADALRSEAPALGADPRFRAPAWQQPPLGDAPGRYVRQR